ALLGLDADDSASEAEEQDLEEQSDYADADKADEAALTERVLFELDGDAFATKQADDSDAEAEESHEVVVEDGDAGRRVPLRVAWADLEDSPSEYDDEWEQMRVRDWAKVATASHIPAAGAADRPDRSRCDATPRALRLRRRRRRRAGAHFAS
ncbi:unnamed protein product, partial [Prorocentrum cordatum]